MTADLLLTERVLKVVILSLGRVGDEKGFTTDLTINLKLYAI